MTTGLLLRTARGWSWLIAAASVVLPGTFYLWQSYQFSRWAEAQDGPVCGMPFLGVVLLTAISASGLSGVALILGLLGYQDSPSPRSKFRLLELWLVALPAILLVLGLAVAIVSAL